MVLWAYYLLATTGLSVLLLTVYWFCKPFVVKVMNLYLLIRYGMAETAQRFTDGGHDVVTASFLRYGRVYFINGWFEAQKVFGSSAFHARLGDIEGLRLLGMDAMGIIWNNDDPKWRMQRKIFTEAVQDRRDAKRREVARLCHDAVQLTLREARNAEVATKGNDDNSVVQLNGLNLLRCITCRVTLALAFGLQPGSMSYTETLGLVCKVNAFFKAWEFFLLRPGWYLWVFRRREALHHRQSVSALRKAVEDVLNQATAGGCDFGSSATTTATATAAAAIITTATATPTATHAPFLKSILEHIADERLSRAEVVQLSLEMIIAGTDTSSVTLFYSLLAIRDDQELQKELWSELRQKTEGPCYELRDLRLLQAVLSEAMRYKPVGPVVIRQATKDFSLERLPLQTDGGIIGRQQMMMMMQMPQRHGGHDQQKQQEEERSRHEKGQRQGRGEGLQQQRWFPRVLQVRKGDTVVVNLAHMHRDPDIFSYPNTFDIRNFLDPPPPPSTVYGNSVEPMPIRDVTAGPGTRRCFLPFGDGQKGCVGKLLAMDEMTAIMWSLAQSLELPPLASSSPTTSSRTPPRQRQRQAALIAPRLADLETKWEVANQPKEEMLLDVRFTSTSSSPPTGPSTPERFPAPSSRERGFPISTSDGGLPLVLPPPPPPAAAAAWPRDFDTDDGATMGAVDADPLPNVANTSAARTTPLPPLMLWSRQRRQCTTFTAPQGHPASHQRRRVMVYLTGPGGVGKTTLLRDADDSWLAARGFTTRTEEARGLLKFLRIGQSQLENDDAAFLKFQKELIKRHFHREALARGLAAMEGEEEAAAAAATMVAAKAATVEAAEAAAMGAAAEEELTAVGAVAEAPAAGTVAPPLLAETGQVPPKVAGHAVKAAEVMDTEAAAAVVATAAAAATAAVGASGAPLLCDRSAIDALCYTAFRFGIDSPQVEEVLGMAEMKRLLELYGGKTTLPPSDETNPTNADNATVAAVSSVRDGDADADDGSASAVRISPGAASAVVSIRCLHVLVPPFQQSSEQYDAKICQQQRLEQRDRRNGKVCDGMVGAAGVTDGKEADDSAAIAVEDDGVRLRVNLSQLEKHTAIAAVLLQRLRVPYVVLRERGREARCRELRQILDEHFI